jgi:hypothetical protein
MLTKCRHFQLSTSKRYGDSSPTEVQLSHSAVFLPQDFFAGKVIEATIAPEGLALDCLFAIYEGINS